MPSQATQCCKKIISLSRALLCVSIFGFSCLLFSCTKDPYLYDRAGFEAGNRPKNVQINENSPTKVAPDYYYRQQAPNQGYGQQYQPPQPPQPQQQYQQYAPQGYNPAPQQYSQPYQYQQQPSYYPPQGYGQQGYQQVTPGSRFYSNPYAIPPSTNYPYYDADQYYVPPSYSANAEYQSSPRPDAKY